MRATQRGRGRRIERAVAESPALGRSSVGQHGEQRGLAGAVRPEQADDRPRGARRTRGDRAPAAEVTGDVVDRDLVEVDASPNGGEASRGDALAASLRPGDRPRRARRRCVRAR